MPAPQVDRDLEAAANPLGRRRRDQLQRDRRARIGLGVFPHRRQRIRPGHRSGNPSGPDRALV